jgi:hypothetical protein
MLTAELSNELEKLQTQCLKIIYGFDKSRSRVMECSGLQTLEERRKQASVRFAKKCAENSTYADWFPKNPAERAVRKRREYREDYARCDRLKNSPIYYMRRLLNEE